MNIEKAGVIITLTILVSVSIIPLGSAITFHDSDEYYFEDVNVLIIGRCRTIGSDEAWVKPLFIGSQPYPKIHASATRFERLRVIIFNDSINAPIVSLSGLINTDVFMHDADGIFFHGCWAQFSARLIPSIVFVYCHADKVWINTL